MKRFHALYGFTLIELTITLVVAALLLAWGVPNFKRFMDNTTLSSETNNWVGLVNQARNEAVTRRERVTICRTINPDACDGSSNCACGVSQSGPESGRPNYHRGYLVFTSTGNSSSIDFIPGNDNVLIATGRTQSDKITIRGNGQADNAFSFMPDGTLDPDDVDSAGLTARHVVCVTDEPGDLQASQNTEKRAGRAVIISQTGRPRVAELGDSNCAGTAADTLAE